MQSSLMTEVVPNQVFIFSFISLIEGVSQAAITGPAIIVTMTFDPIP